MIRCVLVASVALHVAVFAALPNTRPTVVRPATTPSIIEVANERPKELAPPPVPADAPRAATALKPRSAVPARNSGTTQATDSNAATTNDMPSDAPAAAGDGPADFTSTVISNTALAPAPSVRVKPSAAPSVRMVPVSSLSRRPGAPGLDAELERNYPIEARRAGISGTAKLRVQILPDGRVGHVESIFESRAGFGGACARTVRSARWEPPLDADGIPVGTEITYVCKFEVRS
jgi:protein TonB